MNAQELIAVFHDTQALIARDPGLQERTHKAQKAAKIYRAGFRSLRRSIKSEGNVTVLADTTFHCAAQQLKEGGKIAVLNFANPIEPGGGVLRGAKAQEEDLCRHSDLYNVLAQPRLQKEYYRYHYEHCDNLGSDRLIYSPGITVLKSDDPVPQLLATPFQVDVITCAAPYLDEYDSWPEEKLNGIYRSRIRNILEAAMDNRVDILILGAFGCGAFRNSPRLMAEAFRELLIDKRYARHFQKVIFAIKSSGSYCPNLFAFTRAFE